MLSYKQVQRLSKEIASTKQSLKRLRRAVSNLFLRAQQITVVLAVYMLSEYDIGAARAYVRFAHGQKRANAYAHTEYTDATLDARIENWYLEAASRQTGQASRPWSSTSGSCSVFGHKIRQFFGFPGKTSAAWRLHPAATASVLAPTCQKILECWSRVWLDHSTTTRFHTDMVATCANGQKDIVKGSIYDLVY